MMDADERPRPVTWNDWYSFAADEFGFGADECVEYANLRFVEEQNRASLEASNRRRPRVALARRSGLRLS